MNKGIRYTVDILAIGLAVFATIVAAIGVFDNTIVSGLTSLLGMVIAVLRLEVRDHEKALEKLRLVFHFLMILALILLYWEWAKVMFEQEELFILISNRQDMFAWIAIAAIGYMVYRLFGKPMAAVLVAAALYLLLPDSFFGAGENWIRSAENLWFSTDGVFGRPVEVISRIVLIFIVFGAILQRSGAGEVLLRISLAVTGRFAGGPAFAAVAASAAFGSISGTPIANVVSTGTFTIPIIKKVGYKPAFAGGVEAAASTGGQLMPPVMSAVAFLMADLTGISYLAIIVAAFIPALMYYGSLFVVVYQESKKLGIKPIRLEERIRLNKKDLLQSLTFIFPLIVIVAVLLTGRTAQNAGFYGMIAAFVCSLIFFPSFRNPAIWIKALVDAGKTSATLMVVVTGIGFVIGVLNMTGVGLMFAEKVLTVASGNIWFALILVMVACLIMGMGVPIGAAYLMIAITLGPALNDLGLSLMAAHLFIVYYAGLSMVTPPVALAAFTAAPIADADPFQTGWAATRLSIAGFIIPFLFVFHPSILLIVDGFSVPGLIWAVLIFIGATWAISSALSGWERVKLPAWQRVPRLIAAGLLINPNMPVIIPGFGLLVACMLINYVFSAKGGNPSANLPIKETVS